MANEYLPFAYSDQANVVSQADWAVLVDRPTGFKRGLSVSRYFNKAWRQASVMTAAIAAFIDAHVTGDVLDDGDVGALSTLFAEAIGSVAGGVVTSVTPPASPGPGQLWFDPVSTQLFVSYNDQWVIAVNPGSLDGGTYGP